MSNTVSIDGVRMDRAVLAKAAEIVKQKPDGKITNDDAVKLFSTAMDAGRLTQAELDAFELVKFDYQFKGNAKAFLDYLVNQAQGKDKTTLLEVEIAQKK